MFKPLSRKQYRELLWKERYGKEDCPFCDQEKNQSRILWKGKHWYLIYNLSSYSGDHRHIMAVPHEHICYSHELTPECLSSLHEVYAKVKEFFGDEEYFSFTRETMWHRSVEHLHMHFLAGKLQWKFLRKMLEVQGFPITQDLNIN